MNTRLQTEHALKMARKLVAVIAPCLRPEEQNDCLTEFVAICKDGIADYAEAAERMQARMRPINTKGDAK
jgi:hypothetical protein